MVSPSFILRWTILGITLNWYENRVFYNNLKAEEALNVMSDEEVCYILHIYALTIEELDVGCDEFISRRFNRLERVRK